MVHYLQMLLSSLKQAWQGRQLRKTVMHLGKGTLFCLLLPYWSIQWKTVLAPLLCSPLWFHTAQVSSSHPSLPSPTCCATPPGLGAIGFMQHT